MQHKKLLESLPASISQLSKWKNKGKVTLPGFSLKVMGAVALTITPHIDYILIITATQLPA